MHNQLTREEREIWELVSHFPETVAEMDIPDAVQLRLAVRNPNLFEEIASDKIFMPALEKAAMNRESVFKHFAKDCGFRFSDECVAHAMYMFSSISRQQWFWRNHVTDRACEIAVGKMVMMREIPLLYHDKIVDHRMIDVIYRAMIGIADRRTFVNPDIVIPLGFRDKHLISWINKSTIAMLLEEYPDVVQIPGFHQTYLVSKYPSLGSKWGFKPYIVPDVLKNASRRAYDILGIEPKWDEF